MKHKRMEAPEWVFPWRSMGESRFPGWFSLLLVAGLFTFLVTSVRIRVRPPVPWAARKASVIQIVDDSEGRLLAQRAKEQGPFPLRFEPSEWAGIGPLEREFTDALRWLPKSYVPELKDLPDGSLPRITLARKGESVFPKRSPVVPAALVVVKQRLAPAMAPLSGIPAAAMPRELPEFEGPVGASIAKETWRFLLRLDASGTVKDCVSLSGGEVAEVTRLQDWMRRVSFGPEPGKASRWISVGVSFTNQPSDGTDAR